MRFLCVSIPPRIIGFGSSNSKLWQPLLVSTARIHDTCGVHNLHGMPAVLSAIFSAIFASLAATDNYKDTLYDVFPAMNWKNSTYAHNATFIIGVTCWGN